MRRRVSAPLAYISALRLLTGTYAYCGTYSVDSIVVQGTQVTSFPLPLGGGAGIYRRLHGHGDPYRNARVNER